jgi:TetR/AcrR family transcriptional regulator, transcriptional repressor of bet genes
MGRKSVRELRRSQLVVAYAHVLSSSGQAGATMTAIAEHAGVAPGLIHHHFASKHDLQLELMRFLVARFRAHLGSAVPVDDASLLAYSDVTLGTGPKADTVAARAWVALFAEAQSDVTLHRRLRRLLDTEVEGIVRRSAGTLAEQDACAIMAYVAGALVFGSIAPQKCAGFAAPRLGVLARALQARTRLAEH